MVKEVQRDLWRTAGPTPVLRQGHQELLAQDHVQMVAEYLQGGKLNNLFGQPVLVLLPST